MSSNNQKIRWVCSNCGASRTMDYMPDPLLGLTHLNDEIRRQHKEDASFCEWDTGRVRIYVVDKRVKGA